MDLFYKQVAEVDANNASNTSKPLRALTQADLHYYESQ